MSANGRCELCSAKAPFKDKFDEPYLEVHHVKPLAEGSSDRVSNAIALCPNCHRAAHLAKDNAEVTARMFQEVGRLVPE